MGFSDSHKAKGKTTVACIGTITSMANFPSLCINMNAIITAICSSDTPQSILRQIPLNFVAIVNNHDWVRWYESVNEMRLLHWYSYSFLEQNFNCFADFATDFGNGNVMSENCPIAEPNTKALVCALTVMKAFCDQINLHQATMTPITVMPGVLAAYVVSPWNSAQACEPKKDDKRITLADGASQHQKQHYVPYYLSIVLTLSIKYAFWDHKYVFHLGKVFYCLVDVSFNLLHPCLPYVQIYCISERLLMSHKKCPIW
jgi:hypothetical protein